MIKKTLYKIASYALNYLQLQLFITLVSFPILMWWGLPISLLSPLGNLIFSPFLSAFLFISSLFFFTQLCGIPNAAIAWTLDQLTNFWLWILKSDSSFWLFGFAAPGLLFSLLLLTLTFFVLHWKKTQAPAVQTIFFCLLIIASMSYIKIINSRSDSIESIPCNWSALTIVNCNNKLALIDPGALGQKISTVSWVEFTLIPQIIKKYGKTEIDTLILMQPSCLTFQAIELLAQKCTIKNIYMPYFSGSLTKFGWSNFFKMRNVLQEKKCTIHKLPKKDLLITLADNATLKIITLDQRIQHKDIEYNALQVCLALNQQTQDIFCCKYEKADKKLN